MDSPPHSNQSTIHLPPKSHDFNNKQDLISPTKTPLSSSPRQQQKLLPLRDFLLLSTSPKRRSKSRLIERPELAEEPVDLVISRRRCKSRGSPMGVLGCGSSRNNRRSRRRLDNQESIRDEKEVALSEETVKPRKKRQLGRLRKEKLGSVPPSSSSPKSGDIDGRILDHAWEMINDLIMWKDAAKSTLWFGFGSLCVLVFLFYKWLKMEVSHFLNNDGVVGWRFIEACSGSNSSASDTGQFPPSGTIAHFGI